MDGQRDKEVHLPGQKPTDLSNSIFFGTVSDATDVSSDYYYKTTNGLPWAINLPVSFDFPKSGQPIDEAYNYFSVWSTSGGISNTDWYLDLPGNRDSSKIHN